MTINYDKLMSWPFEAVTKSYSSRDTMLYALGIGLGQNPLDREQLRFVYEDGLKALPTMPVVLAAPGFWLKNPETGVDWKAVLHGEQGLTIHKTIPAQGTVTGQLVIEEIIDKGPGKGALIYSRRDLFESASGTLLASINSTTFCRADGGFGGPSASAQPRSLGEIPNRAPDLVEDFKTSPQAALIYRLSGDYNPLHADPAVAASVGFAQPILHGLCSYGVAGFALLKQLCAYDNARLRRMDLRFSSPVYPGETLRTEIWHLDKAGNNTLRAAFRSRVLERDIIVLNNGLVEYSA